MFNLTRTIGRVTVIRACPRLFSGCVRVASASLAHPDVGSQNPVVDIKTRLKNDLKDAMKARDAVASTTIRSVLAEVTNLEKTKGSSALNEASVFALLRKAVTRREEAASQFISACRPDLASKESNEASLLSSYLPPPLSEHDIDFHLAKALDSVLLASSGNKGKAANLQAIAGKATRAFWASIHPGLAGGIPNEVLVTRVKEMLARRTLS